MMCLRDSPPWFGDLPIGMETLVEITYSSRGSSSRSNDPTTRSQAPTP